jgi:MSHA biogenesis protein MshK
MAKHLMIWTLLACLVRMPLAMAEVLRDPTMPAAQSGLIPASQLPELAPPPMLQSITLGTTAKYAMINGNTVMLGQSYEQWVLVKLTASEAVLRAKDGSTKVLVMGYPVKKTSQTQFSKDMQLSRQQSKSNTTSMSNYRSTESQPMPMHAQAESPWVKQ